MSPSYPTRSIVKRPMRAIGWCVGLLVYFWFSSSALAHTGATSGLKAVLEGQSINVQMELDARTVFELLLSRNKSREKWSYPAVERNRSAILQYLDRTLSFETGGQPCTVTETQPFGKSPGGRLKVERRYFCPALAGQIRVKNRIFMEDPDGHVHFGFFSVAKRVARYDFRNDTMVYDWDVSAPSTSTTDSSAAESTNRQTSYLEMVGLGAWHILIGADHLLFVFGLVLGVRKLRELLILLTAFTLAHSLTLTAGALNWVELPSRWVESAIALSILYVGLENLKQRKPRHRGKVTFVFGFLHGFGFSSALSDLGFPMDELFASVISFNLGVELGQIAVVLPCYWWLLRLQKKQRDRQWRRWLSIATAVVGGLWLVDRAFELEFMPF